MHRTAGAEAPRAAVTTAGDGGTISALLEVERATTVVCRHTTARLITTAHDSESRVALRPVLTELYL